MNSSVEFKIAVDFSGPYVNACLQEINSNTTLFKINRLMQRREAALICNILQNEMNEHGVQWANVKKFTVGAGPGSFTGMRIAAAFISGITFGNKAMLSRTVPSAFAIAKGAEIADNEQVAVIFDGRNKEVILFEVAMSDGKFVANMREAILNNEQAKSYFANNKFDKYVTVNYDKNALELILPNDIFANLIVVDEVNSEYLLDDNLAEFDNDLTNLHYIRPSVIEK